MTIADIAAAFSGHRFSETYDHIAADARWIAVGEHTIDGLDAIVVACTASTSELADVHTEFERFVIVAGAQAVAVDTISRYTAPDGTVSVVSSCDVYEFRDGLITTITTYAVEL